MFGSSGCKVLFAKMFYYFHKNALSSHYVWPILYTFSLFLQESKKMPFQLIFFCMFATKLSRFFNMSENNVWCWKSYLWVNQNQKKNFCSILLLEYISRNGSFYFMKSKIRKPPAMMIFGSIASRNSTSCCSTLWEK